MVTGTNNSGLDIFNLPCLHDALQTNLKQLLILISILIYCPATKNIDTITSYTSLTTSEVSEIYKNSIVKPLLKKPSLDPNELKNYCPVSID